MLSATSAYTTPVKGDSPAANNSREVVLGLRRKSSDWEQQLAARCSGVQGTPSSGERKQPRLRDSENVEVGTSPCSSTGAGMTDEWPKVLPDAGWRRDDDVQHELATLYSQADSNLPDSMPSLVTMSTSPSTSPFVGDVSSKLRMAGYDSKPNLKSYLSLGFEVDDDGRTAVDAAWSRGGIRSSSAFRAAKLSEVVQQTQEADRADPLSLARSNTTWRTGSDGFPVVCCDNSIGGSPVGTGYESDGDVRPTRVSVIREVPHSKADPAAGLAECKPVFGGEASRYSSSCFSKLPEAFASLPGHDVHWSPCQSKVQEATSCPTGNGLGASTKKNDLLFTDDENNLPLRPSSLSLQPASPQRREDRWHAPPSPPDPEKWETLSPGKKQVHSGSTKLYGLECPAPPRNTPVKSSESHVVFAKADSSGLPSSAGVVSVASSMSGSKAKPAVFDCDVDGNDSEDSGSEPRTDSSVCNSSLGEWELASYVNDVQELYIAALRERIILLRISLHLSDELDMGTLRLEDLYLQLWHAMRKAEAQHPLKSLGSNGNGSQSAGEECDPSTDTCSVADSLRVNFGSVASIPAVKSRDVPSAVSVQSLCREDVVSPAAGEVTSFMSKSEPVDASFSGSFQGAKCNAREQPFNQSLSGSDSALPNVTSTSNAGTPRGRPKQRRPFFEAVWSSSAEPDESLRSYKLQEDRWRRTGGACKTKQLSSLHNPDSEVEFFLKEGERRDVSEKTLTMLQEIHSIMGQIRKEHHLHRQQLEEMQKMHMDSFRNEHGLSALHQASLNLLDASRKL